MVFTDQALPAALPVNFALLDGEIVFRTATGSKLAAALAKAVVAFQADDIDPNSGPIVEQVRDGEPRANEEG